MNKTFNKFIVALLIASLFVFPMAGVNGGVQAQDFYPPTLEPSLSADGLTLQNGVPTMVVMVDPNPAMQGIKIPAPEVDKALSNPAAANATFSITYVAAGGTDPWGKVCQDFPAAAKTAFDAAAAIWASTLQSSVPITISACWSNLGSSSILGYSGGADSYRDFTGAPKPNTWYESSLANALHGSDLDATKFDDYITYNSNFTWYYGTDGLPPAGTYDLVTVAAHEIAHGLNFSGTANNSGGTGSYGYGGYPNIYDTFMEDSGGTKLTSYVNPSAALGTLLTSGSLWFNGSNANAANGGRVKIYAPGTWSSGSSYSHLDEIFNGTINDMMTYSVASGSANHNPGPVTTGLLKDLGWVLAGTTPAVSTLYLPLVLRSPPPTPTGPTPGFWESATGDEFYVTPDQANVDNFAIYINVTECGIYKITHLTPEPIVGNQFSFSGSFYASGTFDSATSAHGTDGLNSFFIAGCGTVKGGPWNWTATWTDSSQPAIVIEGDAPSVILVPELPMPSYYHTITIKQ